MQRTGTGVDQVPHVGLIISVNMKMSITKLFYFQKYAEKKFLALLEWPFQCARQWAKK